MIVVSVLVALVSAFVLGWYLGQGTGRIQAARFSELELASVKMSSEAAEIYASRQIADLIFVIEGLLKHIRGVEADGTVDFVDLAQRELDWIISNASSN